MEKFYAHEIISCGGAINSPQLLQLSGVGNRHQLSKLDIDMVHNLPGVGQNLQDHLEVYVQWACKKPVSLYPMLNPKTGEYTNSENLKVHPRMKELYKFFKYNGKVVDIDDFNRENLNIFSRKVLTQIENEDDGWEDMLPSGVAEIIKKKQLFGYKSKALKN